MVHSIINQKDFEDQTLPSLDCIFLGELLPTACPNFSCSAAAFLALLDCDCFLQKGSSTLEQCTVLVMVQLLLQLMQME